MPTSITLPPTTHPESADESLLVRMVRLWLEHHQRMAELYGAKG